MLCPRVAFQDQKALFDCNENEGHSGQFVYLRDDREDKEYFGLCEVEVFVHKGESRERPEVGSLGGRPLFVAAQRRRLPSEQGKQWGAQRGGGQ